MNASAGLQIRPSNCGDITRSTCGKRVGTRRLRRIYNASIYELDAYILNASLAEEFSDRASGRPSGHGQSLNFNYSTGMFLITAADAIGISKIGRVSEISDTRMKEAT